MRLRPILFLLLTTFLVLSSFVSFQAKAYQLDNGDAMINGGCEMTNLVGWTMEGGFTNPPGVTNLYIGSSAPSPTHVFALNNPTYSGSIYCYQTFDTPIATGDIANFSIMVKTVGTLNAYDSQVYFVYNDSTIDQLDTTNNGAGFPTWTLVTFTDFTAGKFLETIRLYMYNLNGIDYVYYDNVKLMVNQPPPEHTYVVLYNIPNSLYREQYYFRLYQTVNYTYYGGLVTDGYFTDNGTVSVYITDLATGASISWADTNYHFAFNESFTNGQYYFLISATNNASTTLYRGLKQRYYVNNTLVYTYGQLIEYDVYGSNPTTTNPSGNNTTFTDSLIATLIPLGIFLFVPILFLLLLGGLPSIFIGLGISTVVTVWAFPGYFWIVPLVGVVFILLIAWRH